jgi:hypothetical protein
MAKAKVLARDEAHKLMSEGNRRIDTTIRRQAKTDDWQISPIAVPYQISRASVEQFSGCRYTPLHVKAKTGHYKKRCTIELGRRCTKG